MVVGVVYEVNMLIGLGIIGLILFCDKFVEINSLFE